jgi:holo-[acyl-carrier protein] synthase
LIRWGDRFVHRVFTPVEIAYATKHTVPALPFSARFAVKEAMVKALGMGIRMGIQFREIETINDPLGKPTVRLSGTTKKIADEKQVSDIFVSVSHEKEYAIAQIILTGP